MVMNRKNRVIAFCIITVLICAPLVNISAFGTGDDDWRISSFTANPIESNVGNVITFTVEIMEENGEASDDFIEMGEASSKYSYKFDMGDGKVVAGFSNSNKITVHYIYGAVGEYQVSVLVKNQDTGVSKTKQLNDLIKIHEEQFEPDAIISAPSSGKIGEVLSFDGSDSFDSDGTIVSYEWDFGDGTVAPGSNVKHAFSSEGTYVVILHVTDNDGLTDVASKSVLITNGELPATNGYDQVQEDTSGGYIKIYGDRYFAQSFKPEKYGMLLGVELCLERQGRSASFDGDDSEDQAFPLLSKALNQSGIFGNLKNMLYSFITEIYNYFNSNRNDDNEEGSEGIFQNRNKELTVSIKDSLDNWESLTTKKLEPTEISKETEWIYVDFKDIKLRLGEEYYIVVHQAGGDTRNYYKWYHSGTNVYIDGDSYSKESAIGSWDKHVFDFAFKTVGDYSGDEPDGTVDHWTVVVGESDAIYADNDARNMADILSNNDWNTELLIDVSASELKNILLTQIESQEDEDDVVLFYFSGHGYDVKYKNTTLIDLNGSHLLAEDINEIFGEFASDKIIFIFDSCSSGGFIDQEVNLKKENRIILASTEMNKSAYARHSLKSGIFTYYLIMGMEGIADNNHNGEVSAKEAFDYAKQRTMNAGTPTIQIPQAYYGFSGDIKLTEC